MTESLELSKLATKTVYHSKNHCSRLLLGNSAQQVETPAQQVETLVVAAASGTNFKYVEI